MNIALSIAGSDSGAGAGIQADLKTFAALGVYGCTAITVVTAQNTRGISGLLELPPNIIYDQISSVLDDIPPDAIKVGIVYGRNSIDAVARAITSFRNPIIVDPIFASTTGTPLLKEDAIERFVEKLLPRAFVVTPNKMEAELISGMKINDTGQIIEVGKKIRSLGPQNVIIKGGHFGETEVFDYLINSDGLLTSISNPRTGIQEHHGSGCNFSAALTAFLAKKKNLQDAFLLANLFVNKAMQNQITIGRGLQVVNPIGSFFSSAMKFDIVNELQGSIDQLVETKGFANLIPETQTNFGYAMPDAKSPDDVAAVRGRIVRAGEMAVPVSRVEFGASQHVSRAIIAYMKRNPQTRSALNMRFDNGIIDICRSLYPVSSYNRADEPDDSKRTEGATISWGIEAALSSSPEAEIIYHTGDYGKEAMILVFGKNPSAVVTKVKMILDRIPK